MIRSRYRGNTLSEYALILVLVAVAGIGALSLLGQSTSDLLVSSSDGETHESMMRLVSMDFGGSGSYSGTGGTGPVSGNGSPSVPTPVNLRMVESGSGGVNVSSAEGIRINIPGAPEPVNKSLTTARQFEYLATHSTNPAMAKLYQDIADEAYFLAISQASFEVVNKGKDDTYLKNMTKFIDKLEGSPVTKMMTSLKSIDQWTGSLGKHREEILNAQVLSPAERESVLLMLDGAIGESRNQYDNILTQNPDYQKVEPIEPPDSGSKEMEQLRQLAISASTDEILGDNAAIDASVKVGVNLDSL